MDVQKSKDPTMLPLMGLFYATLIMVLTFFLLVFVPTATGWSMSTSVLVAVGISSVTVFILIFVPENDDKDSHEIILPKHLLVAAACCGITTISLSFYTLRLIGYSYTDNSVLYTIAHFVKGSI